MDNTKTLAYTMLSILKAERDEISLKYVDELSRVSLEQSEVMKYNIHMCIKEYLKSIRELSKTINELKLLCDSFK